MVKKKINFKDAQQLSRHRYNTAFQQYNQLFQKEIKQLEIMQPSAIDAMRIHRYFSITTLWPPIHTAYEISRTLNQLNKISNKT